MLKIIHITITTTHSLMHQYNRFILTEFIQLCPNLRKYRSKQFKGTMADAKPGSSGLFNGQEIQL